MISSPSMETVPFMGRTSPAMVFMKVVFPHPDGPDDDHELPLLDGQGNVIHGEKALRVLLEFHRHMIRHDFVLRPIPVHDSSYSFFQ